MTDHLSTFISTIFKRCTSQGDLCLYVFPHVGPRKAERQEWVGRHNLKSIQTTIDYARSRPSSVFSPPVALYGPGVNSHGVRTSADSNVLEAPAIALELDDTPTESRALAEAVLGTPTLVVRSGGVTAAGENKLHLYWRLTEPARTPDERARLKAVRGALAEVFNGDPSGVPLCHPMRWPGSWHTKGSPRLCEIIEQSDSEVNLDQAYDALMMMAPQRVRGPVESRDGFKTAVALSGEELTRLLSKAPNGPGVTWDEWNRTGMTVFDASHGSDEGLAAFHAWSSADSRYDEAETDARWYHWFNSPPKDLSAASLYHAAGETVPRLSGMDMFGDEVEMPAGVLVEPPVLTKARKGGFKLRDGGIMFQDQQLDYFEGHVYVTSMDKVMTPKGKLWGQSRFDNRMGGHAFMISSTTEGTPTKSAWEAFLRNQRYEAPTADDTCFRPEEDSMALIEEGNMTLLNAYIPIETPRIKGDPGPFLDHLSRILPVKRDREILLTYMASCVQNIGFKAQWWPVIIGTKGNGKTLLLTIMIYAIGEQYSHIPNSSKMTRSGINFNGWMRNKLFLGLEEIYSSQRRDFLEEFKPYVTNRRLPIEAKGEDEFTGDNRANGIMLTNHVDGVPIDTDERRYAPFITAQTTEEECLRDGLTSAYFVDLWDWLDGKGKYASLGKSYGLRVVNDYLHSFPCIPEFDPAQLATRRPRTSSFDIAVAAGMGSVEQEIIAAIEEERMGFAGGWVSGKALDDLIDRTRSRVPRNKRRDLMRSLGYDWHPHLPDGKPTMAVQPDGTRCKLYVKVGSPQSAIIEPGAIAREYTSAQIETKLGA